MVTCRTKGLLLLYVYTLSDKHGGYFILPASVLIRGRKPLQAELSANGHLLYLLSEPWALHFRWGIDPAQQAPYWRGSHGHETGHHRRGQSLCLMGWCWMCSFPDSRSWGWGMMVIPMKKNRDGFGSSSSSRSGRLDQISIEKVLRTHSVVNHLWL